ncbi:MAG TPA: hypothetical protein VG709_08455 [Actinomycetota bacterium]|nr:hypothetical protein [Actinomycetota bacterium]
MDLDVETAAASEGSVGFRRWLGALVGVTALVVALLSSLESDAGRRAEEALVRASRLSLDIFGRIAASGPPQAFAAASAQEALAIGTAAQARIIAVFEERRAAAASQELSQAEERVGRRLARVVEAMTAPPDPGSALDETTRTGVTTTIRDLEELLARQNAQVDVAERYGTRQERAMFALILTAVAAVLLGVAGLTGERRAGRSAMVLAAGALVVAVGWGASGFVV